MPQRELISQISATSSSSPESFVVAVAQSGLKTAMEVADALRQPLTLLRVHHADPVRFPLDPQELITKMDDLLSAFIKQKNDEILALKLQLPKSPRSIRRAIDLMPPHTRL